MQQINAHMIQLVLVRSCCRCDKDILIREVSAAYLKPDVF